MAESSSSNSGADETKQQPDVASITLTVKTPKDKKDVQVSPEASVKEVCCLLSKTASHYYLISSFIPCAAQASCG